MIELKGKLKALVKDGDFGMERECIRVNEEGILSQKPHPVCFGNKLTKKHITTDFSESQIEMITFAKKSIDEMYDYAENLYDYVCSNIGDEYLWCQSMPCVISGTIPVAVYEGEEGQKATEYREMLVKKYGGERQLISGIHFNFSFSEEFIKELYELYGKNMEYRLFKDEVYLKVTRNYMRYGFIITYLCGSSNVCHKSFDSRCTAELVKRDEDSYFTPEGVSLRNSKWGYRNLTDLFPSYNSAEDYVESIHSFIDEGKISYDKEYYSSVRLKDGTHHIDALKVNGIRYIELRAIDINPFDKVGVNVYDLKFIHLFLIYMLVMDEINNNTYQENGLRAKEKVALYGIDNIIKIDGEDVNAKETALDIIEKIRKLNHEIEIYEDEIIDFQRDKVLNGGYAKRNKEMDYIKGTVDLMKHYKVSAKLGASALTKEQIEDIMA